MFFEMSEIRILIHFICCNSNKQSFQFLFLANEMSFFPMQS